ncbi:MAG: aspartate aminotransferase family protein [Gammaproteobacteria bacterium]|nr:aspartate aminotransferase family protein [Gammaproteobacteria bacterium]MYD75945.1 aspartate aminotransferase family protein [Gammaproteobacteria bacterium]MYJ52805.1 aspartate aminotransferase family protein [Gammaproteobacteria bacterium]
MSHVFPRNPRLEIPQIESGQGCYLTDRDGKVYLDGSGGAVVSCLGHGDPEVVQAIKAQLDRIAFAHTGFFTSEPAEKLATLLARHAPGDLDRVFFVSGGSEANEACLKLARQYFVEKGEKTRARIISRRQSYHGNTLGALATGGNYLRRKPYAPLLIETDQVAPCYAYREALDGETAEEYGLRAADELDRKIREIGAENVMAFVAETVVGATLGAVPAAAGYFRRIREICDRHGVLLILDEVMCGMGRTGSLFACEQEGVVPDIVSIAKGLGGGYQPVGAMLCTARIYETIREGSGLFQHGHTYIGHPTTCAAGLAVVNALIDRDLVARCARQGEKLRRALEDRLGAHPHVGDIRGRGLFRAMEFVKDRETKEPFPVEKGVNADLKKAAFDTGLICYPGGGTMDGVVGDHVLLAPPFIITDDQIEELVEKLFRAIDIVLGPRS